MVAWERWEGTIEYTMMAPISRLTHMLGVSIFGVVYGVARTAFLLGTLALFFDVDLGGANLAGATVVMLLGSLSFVGIGIMAAALPLLFPERGEEMTFVISSLLLVVSGVYYPVSVLPDWMEWLSRISPATYALRGIRASILEGAGVADVWGDIWPLIVIGLLSVPLGFAIFRRGERYAKRHGKLKRSG